MGSMVPFIVFFTYFCAVSVRAQENYNYHNNVIQKPCPSIIEPQPGPTHQNTFEVPKDDLAPRRLLVSHNIAQLIPKEHNILLDTQTNPTDTEQQDISPMETNFRYNYPTETQQQGIPSMETNIRRNSPNNRNSNNNPPLRTNFPILVTSNNNIPESPATDHNLFGSTANDPSGNYFEVQPNHDNDAIPHTHSQDSDVICRKKSDGSDENPAVPWEKDGETLDDSKAARRFNSYPNGGAVTGGQVRNPPPTGFSQPNQFPAPLSSSSASAVATSNYKSDKVLLVSNSGRVCYACSTLSDPSCNVPSTPATTVKYCFKGQDSCVKKSFKLNDTDVIVRDCATNCQDYSILQNSQECSECTTDLCNGSYALSAVNGYIFFTTSLILISFSVLKNVY